MGIAWAQAEEQRRPLWKEKGRLKKPRAMGRESRSARGCGPVCATIPATAGLGPRYPRRAWPRVAVSSPQAPRALFLLAKQPLSLYQMPSPTHTEHRLSPDSANPARPAERTRIGIALGSPSFLTSLLGDTLNHPHMRVVLASPTPYLMHTARRSHPQAWSYMFIQSPSLTHLFPSSQAPPVCLLLTVTHSFPPRSPRG